MITKTNESSEVHIQGFFHLKCMSAGELQKDVCEIILLHYSGTLDLILLVI